MSPTLSLIFGQHESIRQDKWDTVSPYLVGDEELVELLPLELELVLAVLLDPLLVRDRIVLEI